MSTNAITAMNAVGSATWKRVSLRSVPLSTASRKRAYDAMASSA